MDWMWRWVGRQSRRLTASPRAGGWAGRGAQVCRGACVRDWGRETYLHLFLEGDCVSPNTQPSDGKEQVAFTCAWALNKCFQRAGALRPALGSLSAQNAAPGRAPCSFCHQGPGEPLMTPSQTLGLVQETNKNPRCPTF